MATDWRPVQRVIDLWSIALVVGGAAAAWALSGGLAAASLAAGGVLMGGALRALAWAVLRAVGGAHPKRALLILLVPLKLVVLMGAIYLAIVVGGLPPIPFSIGVALVVTAILGGGLQAYSAKA